MRMLNTNELVFENVTAQFPRLNRTYKFDTSETKLCLAIRSMTVRHTRLSLL